MSGESKTIYASPKVCINIGEVEWSFYSSKYVQEIVRTISLDHIVWVIRFCKKGMRYKNI